MCDIPPKLNLPMPADLKYGFRQHASPGQMLFYVSWGRAGGWLGGLGQGSSRCLLNGQHLCIYRWRPSQPAQ